MALPLLKPFSNVSEEASCLFLLTQYSQKMQRPLQEVIVAAAGPSTLNQGSGTITLYDIHTGSSLFTLKQSLAGPKCTVATQSRDGQGGLVLAAQTDKGLLNVYSYQKV